MELEYSHLILMTQINTTVYTLVIYCEASYDLKPNLLEPYAAELQFSERLSSTSLEIKQKNTQQKYNTFTWFQYTTLAVQIELITKKLISSIG